MEVLSNVLLDDDIVDVNNVIVGIARDLAVPFHEEHLVVERKRRVRNEDYFERTIPNYVDFEFREHFRMSRQTFQVIIQMYSDKAY